jgi:hypothetical protein
MEHLHRSLTDLIHARGGKASTLKNEVSRHVLPPTIGFGALGQILTFVTEADPDLAVFVGTSSGNLVMTVKKTEAMRKKKRGREDDQAGLADGIEGTKAEIAELESVLNALNSIRASAGEPAVQGATVERRKLAPSDTTSRIVLAARFHAGVAVPLNSIKSALGRSWSDGAVTVEDSFSSMNVAFPPLTDEGKAAQEVGELSYVVVCALAQEETA